MSLCLVTGGAGFIGSSLARALLARGDKVRIIDNFSSGKRENLADFADKIDLIEGDILDDKALARAVDGAELIFHEAAIPSVPKSMAEPVENHAANATRHDPRARAGPPREGPARRLRRVVGGVRRRPRAAEDRDDGARADLALRRIEAGRRAVHADLRPRVRAGDRLPALLQRVRSAAGSAVRVRGRHPEIHHRGAGRQAAAHLRRRFAVARLLLHRQRHRSQLQGGVG